MLNKLKKKYRPEEMGKIIKSILVVVMKSNYKELADFVEFAKEYKFDSISFNPLMYSNEDYTQIQSNENIFENIDSTVTKQLNNLLEKVEYKCKEYNINFHNMLPVKSNKEEINKNISKRNEVENYQYCSLPWQSLWIDYSFDGAVFSDCMCSLILGNIKDNHPADVWNGKKVKKLRESLIKKDRTLCSKECLSAACNFKERQLKYR